MKYKLVLKEITDKIHASTINNFGLIIDPEYNNGKRLLSELELSFGNNKIIFYSECDTNLIMYNYTEVFELIESIESIGLPPSGIASKYNKIILDVNIGNLNLSITREEDEVVMKIKTGNSIFKKDFDLDLLEIFHGIILENISQALSIVGDTPNEYIIKKKNSHLFKMALIVDYNDTNSIPLDKFLRSNSNIILLPLNNDISDSMITQNINDIEEVISEYEDSINDFYDLNSVESVVLQDLKMITDISGGELEYEKEGKEDDEWKEEDINENKSLNGTIFSCVSSSSSSSSSLSSSRDIHENMVINENEPLHLYDDLFSKMSLFKKSIINANSKYLKIKELEDEIVILREKLNKSQKDFQCMKSLNNSNI